MLAVRRPRPWLKGGANLCEGMATAMAEMLEQVQPGVVAVLAVTLAALAFSIGGRAAWRGHVGERRVRRLLARHGIEAAHDLLLPRTDRPGWTQLDHLAKLPGRILVIETKNLSGCIFGCARDSSWTQLHGRTKRSISNPLHQNHGHVLAVRALAGSGVVAEGLVVLVGTARFPAGLPPGCYDLETLGKRLRQPLPVDSAGAARSRLDAAWAAILRAASTRWLDRWRHVRDLERTFGRDPRGPISIGLAAAAGILAALLVE
jgi:hypothetical protein